jgi:tetratricopeptide (TPR) repeat protein
MPDDRPVSVTADRGSVAAGGGIVNSPITFGLDKEGVRQVLKEELARIAQRTGVPIEPLQSVLEKLGEAEVTIEEIPKRLAAAADELLSLRQDLLRLRNDGPELAVIRDQALAHIDAGDLDAARAAFNRGREAARALREETSRNEAEFLADEARIDHLQLAYRDAPQKYAEAARLVAPFSSEAEWKYVLRQADEFSDYGNEFGDNQALMEAIAVYQQALTLVPSRSRPLDWAMTQNNLGNALHILGDRESGTARLKASVAALRDALKERTRQRVPLEWAQTQNNLLRLEYSASARAEQRALRSPSQPLGCGTDN